MQTPTHLLVAAALLTKPATSERQTRINTAVLTGALLPDLSIYILFVWARFFTGASEGELWAEIYWREPWQTLGAVSNSFPLFLAVAGIGLLVSRQWIWALGAAALAHLALDLPLHHADAHAHFWPLSDWRFRSPLSYWDPTHHGDIVSWIEIALGVALTLVVFRRFRNSLVRAALLGALTLYILVPLYFSIMI